MFASARDARRSSSHFFASPSYATIGSSMGIVARIFLLLVMIAAGCAEPQDRRELPPAEQAQLYKGAWEYRYGESPRGAEGQPLWAAPAHDDGGWRPTTTLSRPPGRSGHDMLATPYPTFQPLFPFGRADRGLILPICTISGTMRHASEYPGTGSPVLRHGPRTGAGPGMAQILVG